ncbi:unnamed protein product [Prunus armeniaca]|uniref:Uncharacterized protein n=1 Tax=Prunus armeniaca TaxID=36596 RepID=A0A6J5XUJ5_PRUAR|nr:unnamed protein product [Prunus armeniaca]
MANYGDKSFAVVNNISTSFYQGHKSISNVRAMFEGHQVVVLEELELSRFNSERCAGVYNIDVKLGLWVKARYGKIETGCISPPSVDCQLKIPLSSSPNARYVGANFSATDCGGVALPLLPSSYSGPLPSPRAQFTITKPLHPLQSHQHRINNNTLHSTSPLERPSETLNKKAAYTTGRILVVANTEDEVCFGEVNFDGRFKN